MIEVICFGVAINAIGMAILLRMVLGAHARIEALERDNEKTGRVRR